MNTNYLSDIKVTLRPTVGGVSVDIAGHDFQCVFTTTGNGRRFTCSHRGGSWIHCRLGTDGGIVCMLDRHGLAPGQLHVAFYDYAPDDDYEDGRELRVTPQPLDIFLIEGAGDDCDLDASVAVDIAHAVSTALDAAERAEAAAAIAEAAVGGDFYTKAESNALLATKADVSDIPDISGKADASSVYTKGEINDMIGDIETLLAAL